MWKIFTILFFAFTVTSFSQSIPNYLPKNGLICWYPFNGNANDESGNAHNPTYIGNGVTLTADRFGQANSAYNFDGNSGSYINYLADSMPTGDRTISVWFNVPSVVNRPAILGYGGNGNCGSSFIMGLNTSGFGSYQCSGHCNYNEIDYYYPSEPINEWIHWVVTIENNIIKIYVNGQLKQSTNTYYTNTYTIGTNLALGVLVYLNGIAPYTDPNVNYLIGKLDDIGIWNRALTACEVSQLYTGNNTVASSSISITTCDSYTAPDGNVYTTSGIKTAIIPNVNGCDSIITIDLTINNTPPSPTISLQGNILSSDVASGNQWYNQNGIIHGATSQNYTVTENGEYFDIVTQNGCSSNSSNIVSVTNTGNSIVQTISGIITYPNPVTNELIIETEPQLREIDFEILNPIGKVVYKGKVTQKITVPTYNFPRGIYLIKFENEKIIESKKIIKE